MSEVMSNLSGVKTKIADALRAAKGDTVPQPFWWQSCKNSIRRRTRL